MDVVFVPLSPFVWAPGRALVVAVGFLVVAVFLGLRRGLGLRSPALKAIVAVVAWVALAVNEYVARREGWNIRIDLLVFAPVLYGATAVGLVAWYREVRRGRESRGERSEG